MKAFEGKDFGQIIQTFTQLESHYGLDAGGRIENDAVEPVKLLLKKAIDHCQSAGLKVSGKALDEIEAQLKRDALTYAELQTQLGEVANTMRRQLSTILLLAVAPDREEFFRNISTIWRDGSNGFP